MCTAKPVATGVKWFEVDKLDVLKAKRRALEAAGATFVPHRSAPCKDASAAHP